ncbi:MAG: hypothetical protein JXA25_04345 [Anaerolineales bacterium]|nr:hypothetical protein [Anaerolineales bacterium]
MGSHPLMIWLLDSDPALRWQVQRDLAGVEESVWQQERQRLPEEGWCAQLLQLQDPDGLWNGSLYNGKWRSITCTLYLLKLFGLPPDTPQAVIGCERLLQAGLYRQCEIRFSKGQAIQLLGVTSLVLSLCCCHGVSEQYYASLRSIAEYPGAAQHVDGYWLPNRDSGAADHGFETTLLIHEGLLQFRRRFPANDHLMITETAGQEFLLRHPLFLQDGEPIKSQWPSFSFPP